MIQINEDPALKGNQAVFHPHLTDPAQWNTTRIADFPGIPQQKNNQQAGFCQAKIPEIMTAFLI